MQNHGGEHIISGLIYKNFGIGNVGFHMSESEITIDTAAPVTEEMIEKIETLSNLAVWEDRPIRCYYPSPEELSSLPYRSKTELDGDVRIVEIDGCDRCACCAPHFPSTAPIGLIHIKSFINYKKGSRLTVACGEDALDDYRRISRAAKEIARLYSTQPDQIYDAVLHREDTLSEKLAEISELRSKLLKMKLDSIDPTDKNICVFEDGCEMNLLRKLATEGAGKTSGVFVALSDNGKGGYNYVACTQKGDLSTLAGEIKEALGGRGGGKGPMISGFVEAEKDKILEFFSR
jgi:alanyl-tRNA synthetase